MQSALAASDDSQPEPDIAVVDVADHAHAHPNRAHLVVEVARSTLEVDRTLKAKLYAESGVPEYWVVNVIDRQIEVHTEIVRGSYARVVSYRAGDAIALTKFPDVHVRVTDVLS